MILGIGFKVTVIGPDGYREEYRRWSEGSPGIERKGKEAALKQGLKYVLKSFAGIPLRVVDILSKPMQGLGRGLAEFIVESLKSINRFNADRGLSHFILVVSISGDFEAHYRVEDGTDLDALPQLLAMLPRRGDESKLMGANIIETVYLAHVNFARHRYATGNWSRPQPRQQREQLPLDVRISV